MQEGNAMPEYTDIVKLWQSFDSKTESGLDLALDSFRILFAYNSGRIENPNITYHTTREIFCDGKVSGFTGDIKALFEQQNQKLCYENLKSRIVRREPLTIPLIKEIHLTLTAGTYDERRFIGGGERPGEFKHHDYVTGVNEVGADPEHVEEELSEMLEFISENISKDALKLGTYLHAHFENIHPFADGNGRTGRTLLNYFLMINGHPPLIVYDEDKAVYYEALEAYDAEENLDKLYDFLKKETVKTWEKSYKGAIK